jgi:hypothetical protein
MASIDPDQAVEEHIEGLIAREHALRGHPEGEQGLSEGERRELASLEVTLDQTWDLLRRRRAARSAGQDPDQLGLRDEGTVEGYQQ